MTQLRHDRPILRYLDNLRRELRNEAFSRLPDAISPAPRPARDVPRRLRKPLDERGYIRHIEAFADLQEASRESLSDLLDKANDLLTARIDYIQSIGTGKHIGKRKASYDTAYAALAASCRGYNAQCRNETRGGKSPTREWFAKLRVVMGSDWAAFEEIDELIRENRG